MIPLAHQLGHSVMDDGSVVTVFVSDGTHTRQTYSHRRQRRPRPYMAVLTWIFS